MAYLSLGSLCLAGAFPCLAESVGIGATLFLADGEWDGAHLEIADVCEAAGEAWRERVDQESWSAEPGRWSLALRGCAYDSWKQLA